MTGQVAKVVIHDATVHERKIGDFLMRSQVGFLQVSQHVAHEIQVRVPDSGVPYQTGAYLIGSETFRTDDYGRLTISKKGLELIPVPAAPAQDKR